MTQEIRSITLSPPDESREFLTINFDLYRKGKLEPFQAQIQTRLAMGLMSILQELQATHGLSIPSNLRPQGTPKLTVVTPD